LVCQMLATLPDIGNKVGRKCINKLCVRSTKFELAIINQLVKLLAD